MVNIKIRVHIVMENFEQVMILKLLWEVIKKSSNFVILKEVMENYEILRNKLWNLAKLKYQCTLFGLVAAILVGLLV